MKSRRLSDKQQRAIGALKAASTAASYLRPFATPASVIVSESGPDDSFFQAVDELAEGFFDEPQDFETALRERGITHEKTDDLYALHMQSREAAVYAAFALGVAWGAGSAAKGLKDQ